MTSIIWLLRCVQWNALSCSIVNRLTTYLSSPSDIMDDDVESTQEKNEYEKLRDEMNAQFQALKDAFEAKQKDDEATIQQLKDDNVKLQTALLRSAFTEPPAPIEKQKTEQEVYQDTIASLFEKSKKYKSMM